MAKLPLRRLRRLAVTGCAFSALCAGQAFAQSQPPVPDDAVDVRADAARGQQGQTIVVEGNVQVRSSGRTLYADQLTYDRDAGVMTGAGNIRLYQPDGTAEFAETFRFNENLETGIATNFSARLADNGKIAARSINRRTPTVTEMERVIFTACDICDAAGNDKEPSWSVAAEHVVRDETRQTINYENAVIRIKGVPVLYLPTFSMPDPSVNMKSGFLQPGLEQTDRRGLSYEQPYLWVISPYQDLVFSPQFNTRVNPLLNLQWRKRFYSGMIEARAGYTREQDFNNAGASFGPDRDKAYILAHGQFELAPRWTWGFTAQAAENRRVFDQYSIRDLYDPSGLYLADDRRLLSQIYTVRQNDQSYLSVALMSFQSIRALVSVPPDPYGIRPLEDDHTLPFIGPLVEFRYEPESPIAGGRLRLRGSGAVVERDLSPVTPGDPGIDSRRASVEADWRRAITFSNGLRLEPFAEARADAYNIADLTPLAPQARSTSRAIGTVGMDATWPFVRQSGGTTTIIEPIIQIALSPDTKPYPQIPNEDSIAFDFDDTNLFSFNKFPGYDLYEGGRRANIGVRSTINWGDGRQARFLAGRSFRNNADPVFPARTGLNRRESDWVVAADYSPAPGVSFYARTRLDADSLDARRIEGGANVRVDRGGGYLRYLREDQDFTGTPREDVEASAEILIGPNWGVIGNAVRDLQTDTWRRRGVGFMYRDDCLRFEMIYQRDNNPLLGTGTSQSFVVRLTLATLGDTGYRGRNNRAGSTR